MTTLTFNDVNFHPVAQPDGQIWLTSSQIAEALEYKNTQSITQIFNSNKDEFDEAMVKIVKVPTVNNAVIESITTLKTKGLSNKMRIFSLRGCHLLAMFARTAKAKEFRKWVLNILAKEVGQPVVERITRLTISAEQQKAIRFAIAKRCQSNSVHYQTVYTAMYEHFNIPRYTELLASDFDEAIKFIQSVELTPQIESKPFEIVDFKVTSQVMEYLQELRREITRLGGNIPKYPQIEDETIVQGIVTRMIQSHRMMLSFDPLNGASVKLVPQNSWLVTEENIADIVGNADGVKKDKLPDIMNALLSRIGLAK